MANSPSGIPFPQAVDNRNLASSIGRAQAERQKHESNVGTISNYPIDHQWTLPHPTKSDSPSLGTAARRIHLSNASSASSSSNQGESLPSIRNLLHSIGHESAPPNSMSSTVRRSPSAPNLPASIFPAPLDYRTTTSRVGQSNDQTVTAGHWNALPYSGSQGTLISSRDAQTSMRSMSPQRRPPPIAPSAFAHSQYTQVTPRSEPASSLQYRPTSAAGRSQRSSNTFTNPGDVYKKQKSLHSPSSSLPGITSEELRELPSSSVDVWSRSEAGNDRSMSNSTKRNSQSQNNSTDATTPSASRRRHTVGALQEPIRLHMTPNQGLEVETRQRKLTNDLTPRVQQHFLGANIVRPDSPTTPTAGSSHRSQSNRWEGNSSISGTSKPQHPASHHRVYMQQYAEQGTGSLPSLSSSVSSVSLSSERNRVQSLEEARERRALPTGYPGVATDVYYVSKKSVESMSSPRSRAWHSRSSTLDSLDSSGSFASSQSPYSRPLPPPRSSSLHSQEGGGNDTVVWPLTPTRRFREVPTVYYHANERARQERGEEGSLHRSISMRGELISQLGHSPHRSATEEHGYGRPRAQTMTYTDRPIAPLPSHSHSQSYQQHGVSKFLSSSRSAQIGFPHSSTSVANLPQRVSSMELNSKAGRVRHVSEYLVNSPSSSVIPTLPTPTSGLLAKNGSSSFVAGSSGGAKYECGWCGKRFSRPSSLKIHHHSHTGEKPFACPAPNCGRTFSVQSNLRRHQKCHAGSASIKGSVSEEGPIGLTKSSERQEIGQRSERMLQQASSSASPQHLVYQSSFSQSCPSDLATGGSRRNLQTSLAEDSNEHSRRNSFLKSRERRQSVASSNAEDEEEEEINDDEGEEDRLEENRSNKHDVMSTYDDDDSMQDIQEEDPVVYQRSALQGLLNPQQPT